MGKRRGAQFWREHVEAWDRSELTQAAYCAAHGLSSKSFYRWLCRQKEEAARGKSSLTLVPVSVGAPATGGAVWLQSPGGWRIELPAQSVTWLGELLRQLP